MREPEFAKLYATLDRKGLACLSWLLFWDPGEACSRWRLLIKVKTTSTLPKLSTSEGPVSRVSPRDIKGRLTVPSPVCLSALFKGGCHCAAMAILALAGYHVWMDAVLEHACSWVPACNPHQFALTHHISGARRTPAELLGATSDPCDLMWRDQTHTHYDHSYLPSCPVVSFQMEPSWVFRVETGSNEETLVVPVVTYGQTERRNHLNLVL